MNNNESSSSSDNTSPLVTWVCEEIKHELKNKILPEKAKKMDAAKQAVVFHQTYGTSFDETSLSETLKDILEDTKTIGAEVKQLAKMISRLVETFLIHQKVYNNGFYKKARLERELLKENGLNDYIEAADNSGDLAVSRLNFLNGQQFTGKKDDDDDPYVCIIASSGTGKTQLAATASLSYNAATTIYLNVAGGTSNQRFYHPHITAEMDLFKKAAEGFLQGSLGRNPGETTTANAIKDWAIQEDVGSSPFARMLYHLFTNEEFPGDLLGTRIKLSAVKEKIEKREKHFLVFLDEVPPKDNPAFPTILCIRDTLRYIGITPILMSTHTGAQDFVGTTTRETLDVWAYIMSSLPRFAPFPENAPEFFAGTERPLVLALAQKAHEKGKGLPEIVGTIREKLQASKLVAWESSPALQLVQLFSTDVDINGKTFASSHNLVGHHFGCLLQDGDDVGTRKYACWEASEFGKTLAVAPVCASYEPLLYLALVTWNEEMLAPSSKVRFPLTIDRRALTVREAFKKCKEVFSPKASIENPLAKSLNGNLLEVLVHASMTLASMKTSFNKEYLPGMNLRVFLPLVRELMLGDYLDELPPTPKLFSEGRLKFNWPVVPALGGSNSGLPEELTKAAGSNLGFLERPKDGEMVDGLVWISSVLNGGPPKTPFMSVECKNYRAGVSACVLKEVFKRIKRSITCSLVFVSSVKSGAFKNTALPVLKRDCFKQHNPDSVSVILWGMNKKNPEFLRVGATPFCAKSKTSLLVVIIEVGTVDADINHKRKRTCLPCANP